MEPTVVGPQNFHATNESRSELSITAPEAKPSNGRKKTPLPARGSGVKKLILASDYGLTLFSFGLPPPVPVPPPAPVALPVEPPARPGEPYPPVPRANGLLNAPFIAPDP